MVTVGQLDAAIAIGRYGAACAELLLHQKLQHTVQAQLEARVL